ncbi:MAG TPA: hypothetical protein VGG41_15085 [Solirubrobacteraceae bacterium]
MTIGGTVTFVDFFFDVDGFDLLVEGLVVEGLLGECVEEEDVVVVVVVVDVDEPPGAEAPPVAEPASAPGAHSARTARAVAKIEAVCLGELISTLPSRAPQPIGTQHERQGRGNGANRPQSDGRGRCRPRQQGSGRRPIRGSAGALLRSRTSAAPREQAPP